MSAMKKGIALVVAVIVLLGSSGVMAEEEKPTVSTSLGVFNKYIWRGYELSDDSFLVQPSMSVSYKGFSMGLWGNLDSAFDDGDPSTSDKTEWTETDLTLEYSRNLGPLVLGIGYIYYGLDGVDDSQEIYLKTKFDVFLSPTLTIYREVAHLPGWYVDFGIGHSIQLPKGITLDMAGSVGYTHSDDSAFVEVDSQFNPTTHKYRTFHNGLLSVGLTIPLAKYMTLNPMLAYSFPLSGAAGDLIKATSFSGNSDFLYGGVTLSLAF